MNKRYFFLNAESTLVDGEHNSAIYDFTTGNIIALEPDLAAVLRLAERGSPTDEIACLLSKDPGLVQETLSKVETHGLGRFYNRRVYIEKRKPTAGLIRKGLYSSIPPIILKCFIEVACTCELECSFCEAPKLYPCVMCTKSSSGELDERNLYAFLKRLLKMQCMSLVFHGGDPLADPDKFFPIIEFCRAQGFEGDIFVITNGTNIGDAVIRSLASYKVHPVIPFAQEMGGLISERMLHSLAHAFQRNQIQFTLTLVIDSNNASSIKPMRDVAERLGARSIAQTVVLDGDGNQSSEAVKALGNHMMKASTDLFYQNMEYHPCLDRTLALSMDGRLLPCPFLTDEVVGDAANPWLLDDVFESQRMEFTYWRPSLSQFEPKPKGIDPYWELSLSTVEGCKDCAFRYGCLDCRALEKYLTGSLYGKDMCALKDRITRR